MNRSIHLLSTVLATGVLVAACGGGTATNAPTPASTAGASMAGDVECVSGSIIDGGSTALQPLVEAARDEYQAACSDASVDVQGGGSGTGLTQVSAGAFDIGNSDVLAEDKLDAAAAGALVDHVIARQGWVMVTDPSVTGVTNLTKDQAKQIWTGQVTNWRAVGGPDMPIVLVIRPESSGTRATFKKLVLDGETEAAGQALTVDSNGAVAQTVKTTPGATSVIGFAYYQSNHEGLNALQLNGVDATVANMTNDTYLLQAFGHMYTKGEATGLAKAFIDFMLSDTTQNVLLPSLDYAPVGR